MSRYIVADVGGTNIRTAYFTSKGVFPKKVFHTKFSDSIFEEKGKKKEVHQLFSAINKVLPEHNRITAICVAVPGLVDIENGIVLDAPNIPGWENIDLRRQLEDFYELPVVIGNDASFAALGEWKIGAGKSHHHMIFLTIGTGIGGGLIVDDKLLVGAQGFGAELGHITVLPEGPLCNCGRRGHLSAIASGSAISRWYIDQKVDSDSGQNFSNIHKDTEAISLAGYGGDQTAVAAFDRAGKYIGLVLADLIHIFNPTAIIIGGGVSKTGSLLMEPIKKSIYENTRNSQYLEGLLITTSELGDEAGLIGGRIHLRSIFSN